MVEGAFDVREKDADFAAVLEFKDPRVYFFCFKRKSAKGSFRSNAMYKVSRSGREGGEGGARGVLFREGGATSAPPRRRLPNLVVVKNIIFIKSSTLRSFLK